MLAGAPARADDHCVLLLIMADDDLRVQASVPHFPCATSQKPESCEGRRGRKNHQRVFQHTSGPYGTRASPAVPCHLYNIPYIDHQSSPQADITDFLDQRVAQMSSMNEFKRHARAFSPEYHFPFLSKARRLFAAQCHVSIQEKIWSTTTAAKINPSDNMAVTQYAAASPCFLGAGTTRFIRKPP